MTGGPRRAGGAGLRFVFLFFNVFLRFPKSHKEVFLLPPATIKLKNQSPKVKDQRERERERERETVMDGRKVDGVYCTM